MANQVFFFTPDGQFGDAEGLVFIEVKNWETGDLEAIADIPPWDRKAFAQDMARFVELGRPKDFWTDDLHVAPKYQTPKDDLI